MASSIYPVEFYAVPSEEMLEATSRVTTASKCIKPAELPYKDSMFQRVVSSDLVKNESESSDMVHLVILDMKLYNAVAFLNMFSPFGGSAFLFHEGSGDC